MRALILADGASRGALAGARALADAGWSVAAGGPEASTLLTRSRAVSSRHAVRRPQGDLDRFADDVAAAVRSARADVVFPSGDDWLLALSTVRERIPAVVPYPDHARVVALLDKGTLAQTALAAGIAAPRTVRATPATIEGWDGPAIVKAATHWAPVSGAPSRLEAERCEGSAAIAVRVDEIAAAGGQAVLQTCVAGELRALTTVVGADGDPLAMVQQRASRLWPVPTGISARAETVAVDDRAAESVARLAAATRWHGLLEVQFLVDEVETWWLIDANARFYGSMQLAIAAGVNLPDLWGRSALAAELPRGCVTARPGARYSWLEGDLRRALSERRGGLPADVAGTIVHAVGATHSTISLRDPRPTLGHVATLARRAASKAAGRRGT